MTEKIDIEPSEPGSPEKTGPTGEVAGIIGSMRARYKGLSFSRQLAIDTAGIALIMGGLIAGGVSYVVGNEPKWQKERQEEEAMEKTKYVPAEKVTEGLWRIEARPPNERVSTFATATNYNLLWRQSLAKFIDQHPDLEILDITTEDQRENLQSPTAHLIVTRKKQAQREK